MEQKKGMKWDGKDWNVMNGKTIQWTITKKKIKETRGKRKEMGKKYVESTSDKKEIKVRESDG